MKEVNENFVEESVFSMTAQEVFEFFNQDVASGPRLDLKNDLTRYAEILARKYNLKGCGVDDILQESFTKAMTFLKKHPTFVVTGGYEGLTAWLMTIVKNCVINAVRSRVTGGAMVTDSESLEALEDKGSTTRIINDPLDIKSYQDELTDKEIKALSRLPEEYRSPFLLLVFGDFSYREIAHRLKIPEGTVMSRIHRARKALRESMQGYTKD